MTLLNAHYKQKDNHPLSASSIYYNPWLHHCSIYVSGSLFSQSLFKFSV